MNHFYKSFTTSRSVYNSEEKTALVSATAFFKKFRLIAFLFLLLPCTMSWGQVSAYNFVATTGTYTATSGQTSITGLGSSVDDAISNAINIGFTFNYEGTDYTQFKASSNGWITFNTAITSTYATNNLASNAGRPIIAPLWDDLECSNATGASEKYVNYVLTGSSPNRVLTVEWFKHRWNYYSQNNVISFQIKLYETSNIIEFIYNQGANSVYSGSASIGLTGITSGFVSLNSSGSSPSISSISETNSISSKPASDQIYRFTPPTPQSCSSPSITATTAIATTTATLNWTAPTTAPSSGYEWEVRTSGAGGSGATGLVTSGSTAAGVLTANATGLNAATIYSVYVRSNCDGTDFSLWATGGGFTSACDVPNNPGAITITSPSSSGFTLNYTNASPAATSNILFYTTGTTLTTIPTLVNGASYTNGTTYTFGGNSYICITNSSTSPSALSGGISNTQYNYFLFSKSTTNSCAGSPYYSSGVTVSAVTCAAAPTAAVNSNIALNSATVSWTASTAGGGYGTINYSLEVYTDSGYTTAISGSPFSLGTNVTQDLSGLNPSTMYYYRIVANNGTCNSPYLTGSFSTLCEAEIAPTSTQTFATFTGAAPSPLCWSEATSTSVAAPTTLTVANSEWLNSSGFANAGTDVGVKTNLYSTDSDDWLISQIVDLGSTPGLYRLKYDMAVTGYNDVLTQSTLGTHIVRVIISTDGGTTWSSANTLKTYTGTGTYSNTGQTEYINLSTYSGLIKIAFVATTSSTSPDIDFHIDNFAVESIPAPTITSVASSVGCGTSTLLTITGANLLNATSVKVGGVTISPLATNTATQITATVSATISGTVEVTTAGGTGTSSGSVSFTVAPTLTINSTTQDNCSGVTNNTVTALTSTAADYDTYTWSPSTGVSGDATNGWTFNPTATTTYTLTASNAGGCSRTLTKTVTVNAVPSTVTVSPSSANVEPATVTTLTASGGTIGGTATGTVGAGTTLTPENTTEPTAFNNRYENYWLQMVFTPAELNAAGISAGSITAIKFNITSQGSATSVGRLMLRMGNASGSTLTGFQTSGLTLVRNSATYNHVVGENTITFDTPYVWNGTSNLILDLRSYGADSSNNAKTYYTATTGNTVASAVTSSTYSSPDDYVATNPTASLSTMRLNTTFVCNSSIATAVTWSPTTDLYTDSGATTAYTGGSATTVYAKPSITTTYTATSTSSVSSCTSSGTAQINVANMWTGNTSSSWSTVSNWSANAVPTSSDNIVISSNGSNSPVLDVDLTIPSGKSLTLSGSDTTLTIAAGKTLTVAGTVDFGGKSVVFKSDNSGTAALAQITGTLTGATNVTVERYIPAKRGWRLLTAPLKGSSSNTIGANWQGTANEGLLLFSPATYQTQTMTGYTTGGGSPNIWKYDSANTQWQSIPAISTENLFSSTVNNGFLVFATGSHGSNTIASSTTAEATTLKPKGQLITGSVTHTLTANKYHLLGNPYASPINTQTMVQANTGTTIYMVDPTIGTYGGYYIFDGTNWTPSTPSGSNMYLQSGQGFFLKSTAGGTFTIAESHKASGNSNTWFERTADTSTDKIRVMLYKQINSAWQLADGILAVNSASGNHDLDATDVGKMSNFNENLFFKNGTSNLAIEYRGLPAAGTLQPLQLTGTSAQGYELRIHTENYSNSNLTPYLENTQTGVLTAIPTDGSELIVPFTGIAATSAAPDSRFRIVYQGPLSADDMNSLVVGVYPNPVQEGLFTIELTNTNAPASYSLTNLLGQEVQKGTLMSLTNAIPVQDLSEGVYLLQINQEGKRFTTKLMIK